MDVMFYEVFEEEEKALKWFLPKDVKAGFTRETIQADHEGIPAIPPTRFISIRTQSAIPVVWARTLSGILTRSTGFDHVKSFLREADRKIPSGYLPAYCARSVAEHVFMMIFALTKKMKQQMNQFDSFNRDGITVRELTGQNLLVVGVGNIGKEIVKLGRAIGMSVRGVDLLKTLPDFEFVSLESGIRQADVIVCATLLTNQTNRMLGYDQLRHAKKGAILINIARGEISPIHDLKRLLDEEILGGIGLDVFEEESALADHLRHGTGALPETGETILELKDDPRIIFTPHNAFNTQEALERKAKQSAESIVQFLKTKSFPFPVS